MFPLGSNLLHSQPQTSTLLFVAFLREAAIAAGGELVMQNQQGHRCDRKHLGRFISRSIIVPGKEFIPVHTFGGRGSPSL
jgi:hypothetical protein